MARLLVLRIDDNNKAKVLIESLLGKDAENLSVEEVFAAGAVLLESADLLTVVAQPTRYCDCTTGFGMRAKGITGFSKTAKFGWWVHGKCSKPTQRWSDSPVAVLSTANNLLETEYKSKETSDENSTGDRVGD